MEELELGLPPGEVCSTCQDRNRAPTERSRRSRSTRPTCTDAFFIGRIVEATGLSQGDAIVVYHVILDAMKHALRRHREAIRIRGFGTLERVTRQGHKIRHPRTGEDAISRSFDCVRFRAAPTLKKRIRAP
ncbi:hypothetical protein GE253_22830 [Niveispirillum sp. SYP-B3756]|nr:hypothetical protein [Niveispirillum sp. SYP-B3756]